MARSGLQMKAEEDDRLKSLEPKFVGLTVLAKGSEGGIDFLIRTSVTQSSRRKTVENRKVIYLVLLVPEENDRQKTYLQIKNLKK